MRANLDIFSWRHEDMVGIHPDVMCHRLKTNLDKKPVRQKMWAMDLERYNMLKEEVDKLLKIDFIREAHYPIWLVNQILVKKSYGKWRTCVDYSNLNKVYPKDSFSLPRIDQLVDVTMGHKVLSCMDVYSGYNQIPMYDLDQKHTSFITDRGMYCYKVMSFGLMNVGATYQGLVNMMFKD